MAFAARPGRSPGASALIRRLSPLAILLLGLTVSPTTATEPIQTPREWPRPFVQPPRKIAFTVRADEEAPPPKRAEEGLSPSVSLTLEQSIGECLAADPRIRSAASDVDQAGADLWTASLPPNPTLSVSGSLIPLTRQFTVTNQGGPPQLDVGFSFPLDWLLFHKRTTAMQSARVNVDAVAADLMDMVRQRVAAVAAAFQDALEAKSLLVLAREDLNNARRVEAMTRERARLGGVGTIEIDRARLAVLDSVREERRLKGVYAAAQANLLAQIGRSTMPPDVEVAGQVDVKTPIAPPSLEEVLRIADQCRPDLKALRIRSEKASADIDTERARAFPPVTSHAGITRQFQEKAIGFPDASSYGVGIDVGLPLFDRNQGNRAKAMFILQQTNHNLGTKQAGILAEIAQVLADYRTTYQALTADAPDRLRSARSVRDRIESSYKEGGRTLLEVLDAERNYRETARQYILDQSAYWKALHKLNAAAGRQVLK